MPINRHFDLLAPLYERVIRPPDPARLADLLELPSPGQPPAAGWMLDAAGGTGRVAGILGGRVERLVICDLSAPMLSKAVQKNCCLPAQARVERLPFPPGWFTRILVVDAFHHFGDQAGAVRELARVLAPGGRLVIEEPDIRHPAVRLIALGEMLMLMDSHFWAPDQMRDLLSSNGLRARVVIDAATAWIIGEK